MIPRYKLGAIFREERLRQGVSAQELAERTGVAVNSILNFERGDVERPSFELVALLAVELDLSLDQLIYAAATDDRSELQRQLTQIRFAATRIAELTQYD